MSFNRPACAAGVLSCVCWVGLGAEPNGSGPLTARQWRTTVREALAELGSSSRREQDAAARRLVVLHGQIDNQQALSHEDRHYWRELIRNRLRRLGEQVARGGPRAPRGPFELRPPAGQPRLLGEMDAVVRAAIDPRLWEERAWLGQQLPNAAAGGALGPARAAANDDYGEDLAELIQATIAPASWDVNGGPGTIRYFRPLRVLVVRQTTEVHEAIGGLLPGLRP